MATTTAAAIRDRIVVVIQALTPTVHARELFREYQNEGDGDFRAWADTKPPGALRRFQARDTGDDSPPEVTNTDVEERHVTYEITVAYPHNARTGADQALDRDDAMASDQHQIERAIGLHGTSNFSGSNPNAVMLPSSASTGRDRGRTCDFLVITQTMIFQRAFP